MGLSQFAGPQVLGYCWPSMHVSAAPQTSVASHAAAGQSPIGWSQFLAPQVVGYSLPSTHVSAAPQTSDGSHVMDCLTDVACSPLLPAHPIAAIIVIATQAKPMPIREFMEPPVRVGSLSRFPASPKSIAETLAPLERDNAIEKA